MTSGGWRSAAWVEELPEGQAGVSLDSLIVVLLCSGYNNKQIARALGISDGWVKNKLTRIYDKQGISQGCKRAKLAEKMTQERDELS